MYFSIFFQTVGECMCKGYRLKKKKKISLYSTRLILLIGLIRENINLEQFPLRELVSVPRKTVTLKNSLQIAKRTGYFKSIL